MFDSERSDARLIECKFGQCGYRFRRISDPSVIDVNPIPDVDDSRPGPTMQSATSHHQVAHENAEYVISITLPAELPFNDRCHHLVCGDRPCRPWHPRTKMFKARRDGRCQCFCVIRAPWPQCEPLGPKYDGGSRPLFHVKHDSVSHPAMNVPELAVVVEVLADISADSLWGCADNTHATRPEKW